MLGVLPLALVLIEVPLRGLAKDQQLGLGGGQFGLLGLAMIDRIDAVEQQQPRGAGALARLLKRQRVRGPNPSQRSRPSRSKRNSQLLPPVGPICR